MIVLENLRDILIVYVFFLQIIFCCLRKAEHGGESPMVFNRDLIKQLDPKIFDKFRTKGIRYSRNLKHENNTDYITWQNTFFTNNEKVKIHFSPSLLPSWGYLGKIYWYGDLPLGRAPY